MGWSAHDFKLPLSAPGCPPQLCWKYLQVILSKERPQHVGLLYCCSWFLVGFVSAHKLGRMHSWAYSS